MAKEAYRRYVAKAVDIKENVFVVVISNMFDKYTKIALRKRGIMLV